MKPTTTLCAENVRAIFDFDPATGSLIWRVRSGRAQPGDIAGCPNTRGYLVVRFQRVSYAAHRAVWLWLHGRWPEFEIDHKDRDKVNNRPENLRDVPHRVNCANRAARGLSQCLGVSLVGGKFSARINSGDGPTEQIGSAFNTLKEAHDAYCFRHQEVYGIDSLFFNSHHKPNPKILAHLRAINAQ